MLLGGKLLQLNWLFSAVLLAFIKASMAKRYHICRLEPLLACIYLRVYMQCQRMPPRSKAMITYVVHSCNIAALEKKDSAIKLPNTILLSQCYSAQSVTYFALQEMYLFRIIYARQI